MIEWRDESNRHGERFTAELGVIDIDIAREHPSRGCDARWLVMVDWSVGARTRGHRQEWLEPCDAERAKALALVAVRPLVDALAERAAKVAREVAVAVADARLDAMV